MMNTSSEYKIFKVSELTSLLDSELRISFTDILVEGEISNLKRSPQGHYYFLLKDENAVLKVAFFRSYFVRTNFNLENGLRVLVRGTIGLYEKTGELQLYASSLELFGLGELLLKIEAIKRKLMEEGLTDPSKKRRIPSFPEKVGVVTSLEGAALRDFLSIIKRRAPLIEVIISPSLVQGENAPYELSLALKRLYARNDIDVIVLIRGGGSMEDLMAFNDENLARLVAKSPVPIISAIGHEIDFVLTDLTADLRAQTPSVAAEMISQNYFEMKNRISLLKSKLINSIETHFYIKSSLLEKYGKIGFSNMISKRLEKYTEDIDRTVETLQKEMENKLLRKQEKIEHLKENLNFNKLLLSLEQLQLRNTSLKKLIQMKIDSKINEISEKIQTLNLILKERNPLNILSKGYSILKKENGTIIKDSSQVNYDEKLDAILYRGKLKLNILDKQ